VSRAVVALALAGCYGVADPTGTWEPIASVEGTLAAELGPPPAPRAAPARGLRIATWNVHLAHDPDALAHAIASSPELAAADVLLLQEVEAYPGEPGTRAGRIAGALGMTWIYAPARRESSGTHGIAILSRYPLANPRVMRLPHADAAFNERDRAALAADVVLGDRTFPVLCVHLDVRINAIDRIRQLHPAVIDLPDEVAVGGDFNTNPWAWIGSAIPLTGSQAILDQDQATVLDDYLGGLGFASPIPPDRQTFHLPVPIGGRLDTVYIRGPAITAAGVATSVGGSDHWPVWVALELEAAPDGSGGRNGQPQSQ
jgi:endonuclease/exonuclease/phosphatase family metal-dependent hydrolase